METRELMYFVTAAEELNITRAAERLGIAQPPLSRAIRRLERRMGVRLLERTSRGVTLTPAGEVLLADGRKALDAMEAAVRRAQRASHPGARRVLAMKPGGDGGLLRDILAAYESEPDAIPVEITSGMGERATLVRDGRADVALLHTVHDRSGLDVEELLVEDKVAVLPAGHRLAGRTCIRLSDLDGETRPRWPGKTDDDATGPEVRDIAEVMQLIALGRLVAVVPDSARRLLRDDLVCVPVLDAAPTTLALAWPEHSSSRPLAAFVRTAVKVANQPVPQPGVPSTLVRR
ncbi:LysR family transcriptional regulator [Streptomyces lucensis]|uniref:LysR family transcriptional regulator n=1 Tax=Streptomyces lucensis TaxID=67319 RepID=UPI001E2BEAA0|nr:LysR family transcriptional regulator [Streptomyces lucensis]